MQAVEAEKKGEGNENPMREVILDKVVINMGIGESGERHQRAYKMLEELIGQKPAVTYSKMTIKNFGIRKGEAIGIKVTLRGEKALKFLKDALTVKEMRLSKKSIGDGYFAFGIAEHIDLPGVEYDPDVGIFGMDVCVSLRRRGYRVERRRRKNAKIAPSHRVTKEDTIKWLESMGVIVE
ncbi:50S ribosomal protein L5 [Archaeoglobus neptunius]|uniref:50S ribosomal protein L5 n=1 Tax=Archaeoglobus neptunius TaxID=2798580 RepID=UPI00192967DE|nr:50S ribosomal protein L5 [Archaeoglobus neptunius]